MGVVKAMTTPKAATDPVMCIVCGECVVGNPQISQDWGTHYTMCVFDVYVKLNSKYVAGSWTSREQRNLSL